MQLISTERIVYLEFISGRFAIEELITFFNLTLNFRYINQSINQYIYTHNQYIYTHTLSFLYTIMKYPITYDKYDRIFAS